MDESLHLVGSIDVDRAIRSRKTTKVLSETDLTVADSRSTVDKLLALAGLAPFHRACDESHRHESSLTGIEPWRFHVLDALACRQLRLRLPTENAGKVPLMLAAADALVLATWLPNPGNVKQLASETTSAEALTSFEPTLANMEHIAAAAASIQNLLLAATARGIANYWSSGGVLRSLEMFHLLGIPQTEILLGAVFLFPEKTDGVERVGSKLRDHRSRSDQWSRWVNVE